MRNVAALALPRLTCAVHGRAVLPSLALVFWVCVAFLLAPSIQAQECDPTFCVGNGSSCTVSGIRTVPDAFTLDCPDKDVIIAQNAVIRSAVAPYCDQHPSNLCNKEEDCPAGFTESCIGGDIYLAGRTMTINGRIEAQRGYVELTASGITITVTGSIATPVGSMDVCAGKRPQSGVGCVLDPTRGPANLTVAAGALLDANGLDGGSIELAASGDISFGGVVRANGLGPGVDHGVGGDIAASTLNAHSITVSNGANLTAVGTNAGGDGSVDLGPACTMTISGRVDSRHDGPASDGENGFTYKQSLSVTGSAVLLAGPEGGNFFQCRNIGGGACASNPSIAGGATVAPPAGPPFPIFLPPCAACGDGEINSPQETCDDGNSISGDGCDINCKPTGCGNGVRAGSEACDDGNLFSGDGCDANCTVTGCGNGIVTSGEDCDDGNVVGNDGCSPTCHNEPVFRVDSPTPGVNAYEPAVGATPDGNFLIAWTGDRMCSGLQGVNSRKFFAGAYSSIPTASWSFPISCINGPKYTPAVAGTSDNWFVIGYRGADPGAGNAAPGLWVVVPAGLFSGALRVTTPVPPGIPHMATSTNGSVVVSYVNAWSPNPQIGFAYVKADPMQFTVGPGTMPEGPQPQPYYEGLANNLHAWIRNGVYATFFTFFSYNPPLRIDLAGTPFGNVTVGKPTATASPDGAVVVWSDGRTSPPVILGRILGAWPTFRTAEFQVSQGGGEPSLPWVAVRSDGRFLVVWVIPGCGASNLLMRYFDSNGAPLTSATSLGAIAFGSQPQVAALASGEFVITWSRAVGQMIGVFATKYSP